MATQSKDRPLDASVPDEPVRRLELDYYDLIERLHVDSGDIGCWVRTGVVGWAEGQAVSLVVVPDELSTATAISRLREAGLPPTFIAESLRVPLATVNQVVVNLDITPAHQLDAHLADSLNHLSLKAIRRAGQIIDTGPIDMQVQLIKPLLTALGRYVAQQPGNDLDDVRRGLADLFARQRDIGGEKPIELASVEVDE